MLKDKLKPTNIIIVAILAALTTILDIFGVFGLPVGILSVSSFYFASAFYLLFVEVFKTKGAIAIYIGLLMSSFFTTGFSIMPIFLAWGNVLCNVFVVYMMRWAKNEYKMDTFKNILIEVVLLLFAPLISAIWVLGGYTLFEIMPLAALPAAVFGWWLGGIMVYLIIGIPLMRFVMPLFKRFNFS